MLAALEAYFAVSHDRSAFECTNEIKKSARMTVDTVELELEHVFSSVPPKSP